VKKPKLTPEQIERLLTHYADTKYASADTRDWLDDLVFLAMQYYDWRPKQAKADADKTS
jgi:hypothetical protein